MVTDRFVNAPAANRLASVVVSHGGQGTAQIHHSRGSADPARASVRVSDVPVNG